MDALLITSSSEQLTSDYKTKLAQQFDLKCLIWARYSSFLVLRFCKAIHLLTISRARYARDPLSGLKIADEKTISIPMEVELKPTPESRKRLIQLFIVS